MDTLDTNPPPKGFSIALTYSDADIDRYQALASAHRQKRDRGRNKEYVYWGSFSVGSGLGIVGAIAAAMTGLTEPDYAPVVGILIYGSFLAGQWNQYWGHQKLFREARREMGERLQVDSRDGLLRVGATSIAYRLPGRRSFFARSAFTGATVEAGFVLLWRDSEIEIAVPAHLLSDNQRQALLAFGTPSGTATAS